MTIREIPNDTDAVELLSSPPTDDDLDELLEAAAPRRRSKVTIGLVAALIFIIGFLAGSLAEKLSVSVQQAEATAADETEGDSATVEAGPTVVGHVLMIDGRIVYLSRADGATVKVHVGDGAVIGLSEAGRIADLAPGDAVIVHGEVSEDGTVEASSIQQSRPSP